MTIAPAGNGFHGTIADEGRPSETLSDFSWDAASRWLEFRRNGPGFFQWYRLNVTFGVVAGRFSHSGAGAKPALTTYGFHVTGWSPTWLDTGLVPRTWNLIISNVYKAVLRIDNDANGILRGRLKVYDNTNVPGPQEELENDLTGLVWDGTHISFTRTAPGLTQVYIGTSSGRTLIGTFTHNGGAPNPWTGTRGEVLGFGLGSRLAQRAAWQVATRARIANLTEGMRIANFGIPAIGVTNLGAIAPMTDGYPDERDDNPELWKPNYTLQCLRFSVAPGSRFDPAHPPSPRVFDGILATPTGPKPAGGFRAVVAVNGHSGSAEHVMTSQNAAHWYGESAARRSLIVLAIDIGHRPFWGEGPVQHQPIVDAGYADSNWEEDGERAFSVRRAIDWLSTQPNVRASRIFMMGISLGAEVTTITAGLDPRIAMAIPSGYSPDMRIMDLNGNHPCYRWDHADIHEYLDVSDYQALIAPRPLVVQTGLKDKFFSQLATPWAANKQVTRRARAAYGPDHVKLIHYLHYDGHQFHVGDVNPKYPNQERDIKAASIIEPIAPGDMTWQTDSTRFSRSPSLYHLIDEFLP